MVSTTTPIPQTILKGPYSTLLRLIHTPEVRRQNMVSVISPRNAPIKNSHTSLWKLQPSANTRLSFLSFFRNLAANAFSPSFSRLGKALVIRFWIPRKIAFPSRSETSCIPAAISSIRAVFLSCRMAPATDRKSPVVITSRIMPSSLTRKVGIMEISGAKNGWTKVMISAAPIPHRAENCGHMYPPKLCL